MAQPVSKALANATTSSKFLALQINERIQLSLSDLKINKLTADKYSFNDHLLNHAEYTVQQLNSTNNND